MTDDEIVEEICKVIASDVPLLEGGRWSPHFIPSWPKDYSEKERALIRSIAFESLAVVRSLIEAAARRAGAEDMREKAALAAERPGRRGRDFVPDSLWDKLKRETATAIRALPVE